MNKFSEKNIDKKYISKSKSINIFSPIRNESKKKKIKSLAINEVSILRQSRQAANLSIKK